jgi:hypothetical protein
VKTRVQDLAGYGIIYALWTTTTKILLGSGFQFQLVLD